MGNVRGLGHEPGGQASPGVRWALLRGHQGSALLPEKRGILVGGSLSRVLGGPCLVQWVALVLQLT